MRSLHKIARKLLIEMGELSMYPGVRTSLEIVFTECLGGFAICVQVGVQIPGGVAAAEPVCALGHPLRGRALQDSRRRGDAVHPAAAHERTGARPQDTIRGLPHPLPQVGSCLPPCLPPTRRSVPWAARVRGAAWCGSWWRLSWLYDSVAVCLSGYACGRAAATC